MDRLVHVLFWGYWLLGAKIYSFSAILFTILNKHLLQGSIPRLYPTIIYLFKLKNGSITTMCEICSKLAKKTLGRRYWRRSGAFIVNFEQILHCSVVSFADFEQVNASWVSNKMLIKHIKQKQMFSFIFHNSCFGNCLISSQKS